MEVCLPTRPCKICMSEVTEDEFFTPCNCKGSLAFVHQDCLDSWLKTSKQVQCFICNYSFHVKTLPLIKWTLPELNSYEKRQLWHICTTLCALLCIVTPMTMIGLFMFTSVQSFGFLLQALYIFFMWITLMYAFAIYKVIIHEDVLEMIAILKNFNTVIARNPKAT
ncbi:E3 ubiquitin-protein ligase MARCH1 isoform X2 [Harp seal herpesvirus]|uniref:E3 ubiquitin-protein ligase MARCH1 isoform X2 n=1 Tax=phocid gammaherpesvirus 3 TaxID=2560643 RepID=A0A0R5ZAJ1_9GAMA|nr:E3 ubiquitin-protein ligase MARCH1 isoform X2 [Harp seal herpesvirus]AJG42932.1 E3 ubiquitin-protein ligase MARCH1 isoform X2 [Harp seal herpesvirus]